MKDNWKVESIPEENNDYNLGRLADSMESIADSLKELITCLCSVDELGEIPRTPTIKLIITKE